MSPSVRPKGMPPPIFKISAPTDQQLDRQRRKNMRSINRPRGGPGESLPTFPGGPMPFDQVQNMVAKKYK